jgi:DNA-binding transcriptional regulator LsrR (DeoR family)
MKLSAADLAAAYFEEHLSANQIAAEFGISATTVRRQLAAAGFKLRSNSESQALAGSQRDKRLDEILYLYYQRGFGAHTIEKITGINDCTVLNRLRRAGYRLRTPRGRKQ